MALPEELQAHHYNHFRPMPGTQRFALKTCQKLAGDQPLSETTLQGVYGSRVDIFGQEMMCPENYADIARLASIGLSPGKATLA